MFPPFPFEDRELCCVLPWTKLVLVMWWSGSLESFPLKAGLESFCFTLWIKCLNLAMWLQDNRTFSGEKCVEFLLQRQTCLKDSACTSAEGLLSFTGNSTTGKKPWLPKVFELYCSFWINFLIFSPLIIFFFSCTCPHAHFTKRICWNQSCPEMYTHLLKCRGGSERGLCKLTQSWWVLNLWCLSPLAFRHLKVCHLLAPVFGFLCCCFLTLQSYLSALQFHSQIAFWCCHCWLLDSK